MIYYEFLKLKTIFGINKRLSEKENHTVSHVAASGRAMCHPDVSTGSADADVIMTSALTWSTLTKSVVNGSTARSAGSVVIGSHQTVSQETLTCGPRVSGLKKKETMGRLVAGLKG